MSTFNFWADRPAWSPDHLLQCHLTIMEWKYQQRVALIKAIGKRRPLYDKSHKDYNNNHTKKRHWDEIKKETGVERVHRVFSVLKKRYYHEKQKRSESGSDSEADAPWEHYEAMDALLGDAASRGSLEEEPAKKYRTDDKVRPPRDTPSPFMDPLDSPQIVVNPEMQLPMEVTAQQQCANSIINMYMSKWDIDTQEQFIADLLQFAASYRPRSCTDSIKVEIDPE